MMANDDDEVLEAIVTNFLTCGEVTLTLMQLEKYLILEEACKDYCLQICVSKSISLTNMKFANYTNARVQKVKRDKSAAHLELMETYSKKKKALLKFKNKFMSLKE